MFVRNCLKRILLNQGVVATMSDAEILKELVGHVYSVVGGIMEGRFEKVGENWMVVTDKKGARCYVNLSKDYTLVVKS